MTQGGAAEAAADLGQAMGDLARALALATLRAEMQGLNAILAGLVLPGPESPPVSSAEDFEIDDLPV